MSFRQLISKQAQQFVKPFQYFFEIPSFTCFENLNWNMYFENGMSDLFLFIMKFRIALGQSMYFKNFSFSMINQSSFYSGLFQTVTVQFYKWYVPQSSLWFKVWNLDNFTWNFGVLGFSIRLQKWFRPHFIV